MPDDLDARSADETRAHSEKYSPDLVGEELADGARIWRVYDRVAREEDRERIGTWNRGLDNLALFAGLFSAVTTAFIIEARQDTEPDYARLSFLVLNATAACVAFKDEPFTIEPNARATYCLWIASLMLSLTAALIAIMGKDWIGMYASRPVCNPRQWAEIRAYRLACVDSWYMSGVIASAHVMLHISLLLFAAGLVLFLAPDPISQHVALGFALAAGGLYLIAVLSAIVVPTSPFRSPATQAARSAMISLWVFMSDWFLHPPKPLSHPSPANFLPLDQFQHRRNRGGVFRTFFNRLSQNAFHLRWSWRETAQALRAFLQFVFVRTLLALDLCYYHWKSIRFMPGRAAALLHMLERSNRWSAVHRQPDIMLLARSLSHLNTVTQSPDVLQAILVALGDIAIGKEVATFVSSDLKSRLRLHIQHNSSTTDLVTLSRYVLADLHLSERPQVHRGVLARFTQADKPIRSESIVFALVELLAANTFSIYPETIDRFFPDTLTQPRALQHLLPKVDHAEILIILSHRYWDLSGDKQSSNIEHKLGSLFSSQMPMEEVDLAHRFGRRTGLVEKLVYLIDITASRIIATGACILILKALDEMSLSGPLAERPCLVYAFGHASPVISDAAWTAVRDSHPLMPLKASGLLEQALPLAQFLPGRRGTGVNPHFSDIGGTFNICRARTVVMLLSPSHDFRDVTRDWTEGSMTFSATILELCARCLHAHLCRPQSPLDDEEQHTISTLLLERSGLARLSTFWGLRYAPPPRGTPEGRFINILTAIARRVAALLRSGDARARATGARLVRLLAFSHCTRPNGKTVAWDLAEYLHEAEQFPVARSEVSMRRLLRALRALRPLCTPHDDLRAVWAYVDVAPAEGYHDSFWDCDDFVLGALVSPNELSLEGASLHAHTIPPVLPDKFDAHYWLDVAMR